MPDWDLKDAAGSGLVCQDPDFTSFIKPNRPAVAPVTQDPDRYTIFVPSEKTTLSLGQKSSVKPEHINDVGITGRSENHIHFEVNKNNKTVVTLGGPATSVDISRKDAATVKQSVGYAMVTEENAWHEAKKQHYILSKEADVTVRTMGGDKVARVQSDTGTAEVLGGKEVICGSKSSVSLVADPSATLDDAGYAKFWDNDYKWPQWVSSKIYNTGLAVADLATSGLDFVNGFREASKNPEADKSGFKDLPTDKVKAVADAAAILSTITQTYLQEPAGGNAQGKVSIFASKFVGLTACLGASMYGNLAAGISSPISAGVLGGVSAALKGIIWTGVWGGKQVSVKSLKETAIEAGKEVNIRGDKEVNVSSKDGTLRMASKGNAQLASHEGKASMYGQKAAYVGGGGGSGYGLLADEKNLHMGKLNSPSNYANPSKKRSEAFYMAESQAGINFKSSSMTLKDDLTRIKAKKIEFNASGNVTAKGQKILLG
jgi:hypothetical protein